MRRVNKALFLAELINKTKRISKPRVSNIFFSKRNIFASRRETRPICKSKTSLWKAMIIFSDSIFRGGLQEGFTGFQLFKSAAPNSSMVITNEHSCVEPLEFVKIAGSVNNPILFRFWFLARASRKNKVAARKPSKARRFRLGYNRFEPRGCRLRYLSS